MKKVLLPISFAIVVVACVSFAYFILNNKSDSFPILQQAQHSQSWEYASNSRVTSVVANNNAVFICEENVGITAFNRNSGEKKWDLSIPCPHNDIFLLKDNDILISASYPKDNQPSGTFAVHTETGELLWQKQINGINPELEYDQNLIFEEMIGDSSRIFSLQKNTGLENWSVNIPGQVLSGFQYDKKHRVLAVKKPTLYPGETENLYAIQVDTGQQLWHDSWPKDVFNSADHFEVLNNQVFVFFKDQIKIYNLTTGLQRSPIAYPGMLPHDELVVQAEKPYHLQNFVGVISLTDLTNGQTAWQITPPFEYASYSKLTESGALLTGTENLVLLIDMLTGREKWRLPLNGSFIGSTETEGKFYIAEGTEKSFNLLLVDSDSGKLIETTNFQIGESPYRGMNNNYTLTIFDNSLLLESSNIFEVLEKKDFDSFHTQYVKYNLDTGERSPIEAISPAAFTYTDPFGLIQHTDNKVTSTP